MRQLSPDDVAERLQQTRYHVRAFYPTPHGTGVEARIEVERVTEEDHLADILAALGWPDDGFSIEWVDGDGGIARVDFHPQG